MADKEMLILDTTGLECPEPVMLLHKQIREMSVGDYLKVIATDPSTTRDIPKFCMHLGHGLEEQTESGIEFVFIICKGG